MTCFRLQLYLDFAYDSVNFVVPKMLQMNFTKDHKQAFEGITKIALSRYNISLIIMSLLRCIVSLSRSRSKLTAIYSVL